MKSFPALIIGCFSLFLPLTAFGLADDYGTTANTDAPYCPSLVQTLQKGDRDSRTIPSGQVSELQQFLTDYYNLGETILVGGYFGNLTKQYLIKFQTEKGLPAFGIAGSMTRVAIANACGSQTQSSAASGASAATVLSQTASTNPAATIDISTLNIANGAPVLISGSAQNTTSVVVSVTSFNAVGMEVPVPGSWNLSAVVPVSAGKYSKAFADKLPEGKYIVTVTTPSGAAGLASGVLVVGNVPGLGTFRMTVNGTVKREEANVEMSHAQLTCKALVGSLYPVDQVSCAFAGTSFFEQAAQAKPSAQLDTPNIATGETMPTITGSILNATSVRVSVASLTNTEVSYTMTAQVVNGKFSVKVSSPLSAGSYAISVMPGNMSLVVAQGTITVAPVNVPGAGQTNIPAIPTTPSVPSLPPSPTVPSQGTPAGATPSTPSAPSTPTGETTATAVDLKINGSDGPITAADKEAVTVAWTSTGFSTCGLWGLWPTLTSPNSSTVPLPTTSGTAQNYINLAFAINNKYDIILKCWGSTNPSVPALQDAVTVNKSAAASANDKTLANLASALIAIQSILNSMH